MRITLDTDVSPAAAALAVMAHPGGLSRACIDTLSLAITAILDNQAELDMSDRQALDTIRTLVTLRRIVRSISGDRELLRQLCADTLPKTVAERVDDVFAGISLSVCQDKSATT
jgi:hypothetical protein